MTFDVFEQICREIEHLGGKGLIPHCLIWSDDEPVFIQRRRQGLVRYEPRMRQKVVSVAYTRMLMHRNIASLRVHTHTKK